MLILPISGTHQTPTTDTLASIASIAIGSRLWRSPIRRQAINGFSTMLRIRDHPIPPSEVAVDAHACEKPFGLACCHSHPPEATLDLYRD